MSMTEDQKKAHHLEELIDKLNHASALLFTAKDNGVALIPESMFAQPIMREIESQINTIMYRRDEASREHQALVQTMSTEEYNELRIQRLF